MVSFSTSFIAAALLAFSQFCGVLSLPSNVTAGTRDVVSRASRATATAPHWVIYSDRWENSPPDVSLLSGFNVFILSFYLSSGAADNAQAWMELTADQRTTVKAQYAAAGISLMVSAFGSTDTPTTSGVDAVTAANNVAQFVIDYDLDGVDVDYEDFTAFHGTDGSAETWLIALTKQLRVKLPVGQYIVSHAPIAAWFPSALWSGGGYLAIDTAVGDLIDFYNLQFYSQNADQYVTCDGLLNTATQYPGSALFEIAAAGVPLEKLVIGKPATAADASDYMDPATLATCLQTAKGKGWTGGVMVWEYPDAGSDFITTARSLSWPVSGGTTPPTSTITTSPSSSPTGGCGSASAWVSTQVYTVGMTATYNGDLWTAKWWTEGDTPGGSAGAWTDGGACASSKSTSKKTSSSKRDW